MTDYIQWIPANEGLALQKAHTRSAKETAPAVAKPAARMRKRGS